MNSERGTYASRIALSAATAALILAGASLNVSGRSAEAALLAVLGGLFAVADGALNENWKLSVPAGLAAVAATLATVRFDYRDSQLPYEIGGLILLAIGGFVGRIAYNSFTDALHLQLDEMESLVAQLEEKNRVFLAATSDTESTVKAGDIGALTSGIASQMGAAFACTYLASPDGKQFVPQQPGFGLERLHPQPVHRSINGTGPLLGAIEAGKKVVGRRKTRPSQPLNYFPDDIRAQNLLAVPLPLGAPLGGVLL